MKYISKYLLAKAYQRSITCNVNECTSIENKYVIDQVSFMHSKINKNLLYTYISNKFNQWRFCM